MGEIQKEFLKELHDIFRKYSIDEVGTINNNTVQTDIVFRSNNSFLSFVDYSKGSFHKIRTMDPQYTPYLEEIDDEIT